ncbi:MAG: ammonia channel protein [Rhodospirillaceae bacterium]|nr:ammonia channel protein [Rhodospirillaceae bacterium]
MQKFWIRCRWLALGGAATALLMPGQALAANATDTGDTAWLITATALVLFMTLPGLALFYGGLVRAQNVLSVLMHCYVIACLASVLWYIGGYSLAFGDGGPANALVGGLNKAFLAGVGTDSVSGSIPESVFFMFQMTFAIITPALIVGAYVERIKFGAVMLFSALWLIIVYAPITHWVWGGGWLAELGVMDFAGGIVVHTTAGVSALVIAMALGGRNGFPGEVKPPHNPGMTMIGAAMLWVGWFGFNAGSALAADQSAGMAMAATHISAATASLVWMITEWVRFGKPSLIGTVTGTIAGLATITPASGFVGPFGALVIGAAAGFICFVAVQVVKQKLKIDDSLDVFAVHGVGGMMGTMMAAILVLPALGGMGLAEGMTVGKALGVQLIGIVAAVIWTGGVSWVLVKVCLALVGLRVEREDEIEGLDITSHGERGYEI